VYLCVNKIHFHIEYQFFWPVFKTKYICVTESVCVSTVLCSLACHAAVHWGRYESSLNIFPKFWKKNLPAFYWVCQSHLFCWNLS